MKQSVKRFSSLALLMTVFVASFTACSKDSEFTAHSTQFISGAASVAASGSGEVSKTSRVSNSLNTNSTRAANDITELTLHYCAKGAAAGLFTERAVTNTGSHTAIAFNTRMGNTGSSAADLYWQQIEEGTNSVPANLYLTANRESADVKEADGSTPAAEPLWAGYASNGTRPTPVPFGEMQCRLAKFTVELTATEAIDPAKLSVYMNAGAATATPITEFAIKAAATDSETMLIAASPATTTITIIPTTDFANSMLMAAQPLTDADNTITVWYDKNADKVKDDGELFTIAPESIVVDRTDDTQGTQDTDDTKFRFAANEHITLKLTFSVGTTLTIGSVMVSDWTDGGNIDTDGKLSTTTK